MARIIFHVGMGKTGSSTIQAALKKNTDALSAAGHHYLGRWLGAIGPEFDGFGGFQRFLHEPPEQWTRHAETLLTSIEQIEAATGAHTFILSNEQYLENVSRLAAFFQCIASNADLRVVVYVRSPALWLPSAYVQWGIVHKTNVGPVQSFATKARELFHQYDFVRVWKEMFGQAVDVRPYEDGVDVIHDFMATIGVSTELREQRHQARPGVAETILRAACNSPLPGIVLPDLFDTMQAHYLPPATPVKLSEKFDHIFDWSAISDILDEHHATISFLERECGLDFGRNMPVPPPYDPAQLADELLGALISIVAGQTHEIRDLRSSVDMLKRELSDLRTELATK